MASVSRRTLLVVAVTALVGGGGIAYAAFSGMAGNSGNSFQAAASFCTSSTPTILADRDSYVDSGSSGQNFGTATTLRVQSPALLASTQRTLVHFALPAIPSYCRLTSASLRVNASSSTSGRTLEAYRLAGSWTEAGVDWGTQPSTAGTAATTASGSGWREFTVTSQVQAMYDGSNDGFLVRDAVESGLLSSATQVFSSREGANAPELLLTFGP